MVPVVPMVSVGSSTGFWAGSGAWAVMGDVAGVGTAGFGANPHRPCGADMFSAGEAGIA